MNTAEKIVKYLQEQPTLREVNQSKFLKSKTMSRSYFHVTKELVLTGSREKHAKQEVSRFIGDILHLKSRFDFRNPIFLGVSKIKQAWSVGTEYNLLVRDHTCCCKACMLQNFSQCDIKVSHLVCDNSQIDPFCL